MAMYSYSKNVVDGLGVFLDLVSNILERFEGWFFTDGSEVIFLEEGVLVIHRACHGGRRHLSTI